MSRMRKMIPAALAMAACVSVAGTHAESREVTIVRDATEAIQAMLSVPEREIPDLLLREAEGIAIIPGARKIGFVIGRQKGVGVLLARGKNGQWGDPVFVTLSGGSIGWQVGVQSVDLLLFFRTRKSLESALEGRLTLGVDVAIAAGSLGRQAGAATDTDLQAEIYWYARARGLYAGFALSGAAVSVDDAANDAYYGRKGLDPEAILDNVRPSAPPSASELRQAIQTPLR